MARIPNYADDQITLNAPIAEGSGWRASPQTNVDFKAQQNGKLLDNIAGVANALAIREQALHNNMEYSDAVNQATMAIRTKYNELLDRKGENALHFDATQNRPEQKSVTEDWGTFSDGLRNDLVANASNPVVKQKLNQFCNETFPQYYSGVLDHETKATDEAYTNSRAALLGTFKDSATAALARGDFNMGAHYIHLAWNAKNETDLMLGKTPQEIGKNKQDITDDFVLTGMNQIKDNDPELAEKMKEYFAPSLSKETRVKADTMVAPALGSKRAHSITEAVAEKFVRPDGTFDEYGYRQEMTKFKGVINTYEDNGSSGGGNIGEKLKAAIGLQESGNSYDAWNPDAEWTDVDGSIGHGAYGKYQYIKTTWDTEAKAAGVVNADGSPVDWRSATGEQQEKVTDYYMTELWNKYHDAGLVALAWYAGEGTVEEYLADPDNPKWDQKEVSNGNTYPSRREYMESVNAKFNEMGGVNGGGSTSYNPPISDNVWEKVIAGVVMEKKLAYQNHVHDVNEEISGMVDNIHSTADIQNGVAALKAEGRSATEIDAFWRSAHAHLGMVDGDMDRDSSRAAYQAIVNHMVDGSPLPGAGDFDGMGITNPADQAKLLKLNEGEQYAKEHPTTTWRNLSGTEAEVKQYAHDYAGGDPKREAEMYVNMCIALDNKEKEVGRQLYPQEIKHEISDVMGQQTGKYLTSKGQAVTNQGNWLTGKNVPQLNADVPAGLTPEG